MESEKNYRMVFYVGSAWNFIIATALFIMTPTLHEQIGIAAPLYPMFIYFNIMSIFMFGCMQWSVARNLWNRRALVKVLMWAKFAMVVLFFYSNYMNEPPKELFTFLLPGMVIDTIFGFLFWRFLVFSRGKTAQP